MRMRSKKNLSSRLEKCSDLLIDDPEKVKGKWKDIFKNDNPVHLEIGCGKGSFISQMAIKYPGINFVAMEKDRNVIISAAEKIKNEGIKNVHLICENADRLDEYFSTDECEGLYLNFSDPLPKNGYRRKRLTHERYLNIYRLILKEGASIIQKTDNKLLFEFSLNSFSDCGFMLKNISLDLHSGDTSENIATEYELKFKEMGMPIYRVEAVNKKV